MSERKETHSYLTVSTSVERTEFEISVDHGNVEYRVASWSESRDMENDDPSWSVDVSREDFMAMLKVCRMKASQDT